MKTKIMSKTLLTLCVVSVLGSAITQMHGETQASSENEKMPVITIFSTGDVSRGKTGSFVLNRDPSRLLGGTYVKYSVSGTAIPGVDYVPVVSPAYIGQSGYGVILVQTLPDPRGFPQRSYSVVVTLEPGLGYAVGQPSSAQIMIEP